MENNTPKQVHDKGRVSPDSDWLLVALKDALKKRRVSMRQLSTNLEIPYRSIQNYLSGESRIPADVLLLICNEIGLESDYLVTGSFEVSHQDLYDAMHKVFGDAIAWLDLGPSGKITIRQSANEKRAEVLSVAHILTVRLNEAYAACRAESFANQVGRGVPMTSAEIRRRHQGR